ncbi:MAG: hypothetical protein HOP33_18365 [Verrucomicrobia bacterium]|nr:hypothetical protein [Verrucomicrobiota bacterium]
MNPQHEKQLEASVRRELDSLSELPAPPALANRIMRVIKQRAAAPWYRRAWPTWPLALRTTSLVVLLGAFGGLCFGAWELNQVGTGQSLFGGWFADACALWRTLGVLVNVVSTFISRLGTGVIATGFALMFATCVACIGLGSVCVRMAMRPAMNRIES